MELIIIIAVLVFLNRAFGWFEPKARNPIPRAKKTRYPNKKTNYASKKRRLTPEEKGAAGEAAILRALRPLPGYARTVRNLYIQKDDGNWTEIDILLIHQTGMYVFESKAYNGYIYGSEDDKRWLQQFKGKRSVFFPNPIWQNKGHVTAIRQKTGGDFPPVRSLVVFSVGELRRINYTETDSLKVLHLNNLPQVMRKYALKRHVLTEDGVDDWARFFERFANPPEHIIREHRAQLKERFKK